MKVSELIKKLESVDQDLKVLCTSNSGHHDYCIVHSADVRFLYMEEDFENEVLCFVIDEQ